MKIYYQHPNTWFGDCMPFGKDDTFYLFHQRDTRVPCPFGEPFGWDLATTKDFVTYEDCGVAIPRGTDEERRADLLLHGGDNFAESLLRDENILRGLEDAPVAADP